MQFTVKCPSIIVIEDARTEHINYREASLLLLSGEEHLFKNFGNFHKSSKVVKVSIHSFNLSIDNFVYHDWECAYIYRLIP